MQIVCKEDAMSASIMTIVLDIDQEGCENKCQEEDQIK